MASKMLVSKTMMAPAGLRSFHALRAASEGLGARTGLGHQQQLHVSLPRSLPRAATLPLPDNIQDIDANEMGRFSPLRSRDISSSVLSAYYSTNGLIDVTASSEPSIFDPHVQSYDCRGPANLSSSMQSNVPRPFGGQLSILGMPGAQWGQEHKYVAERMHSAHYQHARDEYAEKYGGKKRSGATIRSYHTLANFGERESKLSSKRRTAATSSSTSDTPEETQKQKSEDTRPLTRKEQLKQAVTAYGSTVIVFHVAISLASLGGFYLLVSSGLDVMALLDRVGLADGAISKKVTANAGTFVVAYAVHKVFAPVRIGITLTSTPFIVRYLRRVGILKTPKK